jgi:uncharacterized membrane protein
MTFEPLSNASLAVQLHMATVVPAFFLGTWQIVLSRKGSPPHRAVGYIYLALMAITSIAALFIHEINPDGLFGFSPIHLFVPLTLLGIVGALYGARNGKIVLHKRSMISTYVGALLIAGTFAFLPGRIMHAVIFGN